MDWIHPISWNCVKLYKLLIVTKLNLPPHYYRPKVNKNFTKFTHAKYSLTIKTCMHRIVFSIDTIHSYSISGICKVINTNFYWHSSFWKCAKSYLYFRKEKRSISFKNKHIFSPLLQIFFVKLLFTKRCLGQVLVSTGGVAQQPKYSMECSPRMKG